MVNLNEINKFGFDITEEPNADYDDFELSEKDFYPPEDKRILKTGMKGNAYDPIIDYREEFFKYIENN